VDNFNYAMEVVLSMLSYKKKKKKKKRTYTGIKDNAENPT